MQPVIDAINNVFEFKNRDFTGDISVFSQELQDFIYGEYKKNPVFDLSTLNSFDCIRLGVLASTQGFIGETKKVCLIVSDKLSQKYIQTMSLGNVEFINKKSV